MQIVFLLLCYNPIIHIFGYPYRKDPDVLTFYFLSKCKKVLNWMTFNCLVITNDVGKINNEIKYQPREKIQCCGENRLELSNL